MKKIEIKIAKVLIGLFICSIALTYSQSTRGMLFGLGVGFAWMAIV